MQRLSVTVKRQGLNMQICVKFAILAAELGLVHVCQWPSIWLPTSVLKRVGGPLMSWCQMAGHRLLFIEHAVPIQGLKELFVHIPFTLDDAVMQMSLLLF